MSEYDDIQTLQNTGYWPDFQVPEWAEKLATEFGGCSPTCSAVLLTGLMCEMERLRKQLKDEQRKA